MSIYLLHSFFPCFFFVPMQQRYMVVRETNGVLRTASWEERDKLNQIYFPIDGREIDFPAVFQADIMKVSRLLLTLDQSINRSIDQMWGQAVRFCICRQFSRTASHV